MGGPNPKYQNEANWKGKWTVSTYIYYGILPKDVYELNSGKALWRADMERQRIFDTQEEAQEYADALTRDWEGKRMKLVLELIAIHGDNQDDELFNRSSYEQWAIEAAYRGLEVVDYL
jgi:hypothetical protein